MYTAFLEGSIRLLLGSEGLSTALARVREHGGPEFQINSILIGALTTASPGLPPASCATSIASIRTLIP